MSALIIRFPTELIEERGTILLADFDAETRFELLSARGRGRLAERFALLDKAAEKRARSKRLFFGGDLSIMRPKHQRSTRIFKP